MAYAKAGEIMFHSALTLLEEFPGRFILIWQVPGRGEMIPFDSPEHPYVPHSDMASYDAARYHPNAWLQLWVIRSNGTREAIFQSTSLPTEREFAQYQAITR